MLLVGIESHCNVLHMSELVVHEFVVQRWVDGSEYKRKAGAHR